MAGTLNSLMENQQNGPDKIDEYKSAVEAIREEALEGHVKRMKTGHCSVESGLLFNDMVTALVSISDCASNIAMEGSTIQ
jgi:phosphate:Na+ symporter